MPRIIRAAVTYLASLLALGLAACGAPEPDPRNQPPLVRVATASVATGSEHQFTGVISARVQSDLGFRVAGKVTSRLVDVGQTVRRGQILMRIDPVDLALATATQDNAVAAALARAVQTAADERRYRDLVSAGAVSASTYDQAKAAALFAQAQLEAARAQARIAGNEAGYSVLRSEADGVVIETLAEPGQVVTAGQTVLRLAHAGTREAVISLPETVRPTIGSLANASLYENAAPGRARLRQLSEAADPRTRTYEARYVLEGPAAAAPFGATVRVSLPSSHSAPAIRIPLAALYDGGRGPGVWVLSSDGGQVFWRPVAIAALSEDAASVSRGLRPGERFVAMGAHLLHQGEKVRVASAAGNAL